jgi:hypothetical protein
METKVSNIKSKSGSKQASITKRNPNLTRVNAAGVNLPAPVQHQGAVKGAVLGAGIGATVLAFTPLGPPGILIGAIAGVTAGVIFGASQDEKRARHTR